MYGYYSAYHSKTGRADRYSTVRELFFSGSHGTFAEIDYVLNHGTDFNKFERFYIHYF